ncbi:hypothetical protein [Vibrio vulnificus]|uniref:hypothetical protein n=1 Tax=Vibrio vulnificus TaxID=672 RepID=UPI0010294558|nr:hypothetical protein [Vibrio vulnificus]RZP93261.1 hypothetical protein D8T54_16575 [Vibrio vulnificus]
MSDFKANVEYLCMIQNVIFRMSDRAFAVKSMSITLTAALLAFCGSISTKLTLPSGFAFLILIFGLIFTFAWLDAFFFYTEKKYREIFDKARMDETWHNTHLFDLNPNSLVPEKEEKSFLTKFRLRIKVITENAVYPIYALQAIVAFVTLFTLMFDKIKPFFTF